MNCDFVIVGGGLVGLATAHKLQLARPGARVVVLEKESCTGAHQSTHNSGVLHCGLYYAPGSLKARLSVAGITEMIAFCARHGVDHEVCGKLVVATNAAEENRLDALLARGAANGLRGLRKLAPGEMRVIEPHAAGCAAGLVPQEGIVDYRGVCTALERCIREGGGAIQTSSRVVRIQPRAGGWVLETPAGPVEGKFLINCAGLHCDRVAELAGERSGLQIVPFRGEYYRLKPAASGLVRNLIYPVPDPELPFLGVHFTRLIHGGVECGPNAVLAFAREGYRLGTVNLRDLAQTLAYPGLWRFLRRYPSMAWAEFRQSLSTARFCQALQKLVPDIREEHLEAGGAGVRAQAMSPNGELVQDFHLIRRPNALHVLNAPSPAATAALAIGSHIVQEIG